MKSARPPEETSAQNSANSTPIEPREGTQPARLLAELRSGRAIDPLTAWVKLGIYRLAAIVFDLRRAGWPIQTERRPVQNHLGEECSVGFYRLTGGGDHA